MLQESKLSIGDQVRSFRLRSKMNMAELARKVGTNRSYIYKLEQNELNPSKERIEKIAEVLQLNQEELIHLLDLTKNISGQTIENRRGVKSTMEANVESKNIGQINVPGTLQVLYTDSAFVTSRPFGITIDFAQFVGPTQQQNVVSRIGMSVDHAEVLINVLKKKISEAKLLTRSNKRQGDNN